MPRGFRLTWKGDQIKKRWLEAARQGIDETMAAGVVEAKRNTPRVTGALQGSIKTERARIEGDKAIGRWGSFDINYAIYVETGTRGRPGVNMLRRAADQEEPKLLDRIRERYRRI